MIYFTFINAVIFGLVALLVILVALKCILRPHSGSAIFKGAELILVSILIFTISWQVSGRSPDYIGDTYLYIDFYDTISTGNDNPYSTFEPGFLWLAYFTNCFGFGVEALFFVVPLLLAWAYYILAKTMFEKDSIYPVVVLLFLLFYPFYYSLSANVIRQGIGTSIMMLSLTFLNNGGLKLAKIFAILTALFHRSSIIYLPIVFFNRIANRLRVRTIIIIWAFVSILSYVGLFRSGTALIFSYLSSIGLSVDYGNPEYIEYQVGFRLSFWLFSSMSVVLLVAHNFLEGSRPRFEILFKTGCYFSIIHITAFDMAYNDRFGLYAWILYPLQFLYLFQRAMLQLIGMLSKMYDKQSRGTDVIRRI